MMAVVPMVGLFLASDETINLAASPWLKTHACQKYLSLCALESANAIMKLNFIGC